jgi:site-specific DNA recombinase
VEELGKRDWTNKHWTTRSGRQRGGAPFTRTNLHRLLTNPAYVGQGRYKSELHPGEQSAILDVEIYHRVQTLLQRNARYSGASVRCQFRALLKGLLRCACCDAAMTPAHTTKRGMRYGYYTCTAAQKKGWATCPAKSVPAAEVERLVVERIREVGRHPNVLQTTVAQARRQDEERLAELEAERRRMDRDLAHWQADERRLARRWSGTDADDQQLGQVVDLQQRIRLVEDRLFRVREQAALLQKG